MHDPGIRQPSSGDFRDELPNAEIFDKLYEAEVLIEPWPREYNTIRPRTALNYRCRSRKSFSPWFPAEVGSQRRDPGALRACF
jgi:hypothetical protein